MSTCTSSEAIMQKEAKTELTRQKLLDAVDSLITDSEDPIKVTSRQIAAVSGVQPAMINYCFGSRERLIYEVFLRKYEAALSDAKVQKIVESSLSPKDKLKKLHFVIASFLVKNYSFTKAITSFVLFERDLSKEQFSYGLVKAHYAGKTGKDKKTDTECRMIAYELSTMLQLVLYRYEDIRDNLGLDLEDPKKLRKYIDMRIDLLLP
jgi:AcrR family transcriptional regulator